jgi:hypothetical protein
MDPEYEPVEIEPPPPEKKTRQPPPGAEVAPAPAVEPLRLDPRFSFELDGPFRLDLDLRIPLGDLAPAPAPEPGEAESVKRNLDRMVRQMNARDRVYRGQVHPAFVDLGRELTERWEPDIAQIRDPDRTEPNMRWFGTNLWQRVLDSPACAGDPFGHPSGRPEEAFLDPEQWLPRATPLRRAEERIANPLLPAQRIDRVTALFEVRFDVDGLPKLRLYESSGYAQYDQAALEALATAIAQDPLERPDGAAVALYAATSDIEIVSSLPVSGLGLELVLPLLDPLIPAKKRLNSHVELLSVDPVE